MGEGRAQLRRGLLAGADVFYPVLVALLVLAALGSIVLADRSDAAPVHVYDGAAEAWDVEIDGSIDKPPDHAICGRGGLSRGHSCRYDGLSRLARTSARLSSVALAPNTARALNLPFRDAGLRSQVDDVVRHFDEVGRPPIGVQQGGLKGYPKGTYGGQGLPQKSLGYYTESDVWISGNGVKRGAERLAFGGGGEVYYTPTHYDDFVRIR